MSDYLVWACVVLSTLGGARDSSRESLANDRALWASRRCAIVFISQGHGRGKLEVATVTHISGSAYRDVAAVDICDGAG